MLDIQYIRENLDKVKKVVSDKQLDPTLVDNLIEIDIKRRTLIQEIELVRSERNLAAKDKNIEKGKEIKEKLQELEPKLNGLEEEFKSLLW